MYKCVGLKILGAFKVDKNQRKVVTVVVLIVLKIEAAALLQTIFKSKAKFSTFMLDSRIAPCYFNGKYFFQNISFCIKA